MGQLYLVRFDDGTWLTGVSPTRRVTTTNNWQEAKFYPVESLSDIEWMINNLKPGTIYSVQVSEPVPTQLSTTKSGAQGKTVKPMSL